MTIEQFLAWEERQDTKHEFDGVGAVAMVGGTAAHSTIQDAVAATQFARVDGDWVGRLLRRDAILDMPEIGVSLPLLDLYAGLEM